MQNHVAEFVRILPSGTGHRTSSLYAERRLSTTHNRSLLDWPSAICHSPVRHLSRLTLQAVVLDFLVQRIAVDSELGGGLGLGSLIGTKDLQDQLLLDHPDDLLVGLAFFGDAGEAQTHQLGTE